MEFTFSKNLRFNKRVKLLQLVREAEQLVECAHLLVASMQLKHVQDKGAFFLVCLHVTIAINLLTLSGGMLNLNMLALD